MRATSITEELPIRDLILIPDIRLMLLMVISMLSLGSSNIASHIASRFFVNGKMPMMTIQMMTKAMICLMGASLFSIKALFSAAWYMQGVSILAGFLFGFGVVKIELMINRFYRIRPMN